MLNQTIRHTLLGSAALLLAAAGLPAAAQQQVNNGNALDANTQVGAGGVNQAAGQVDYRARNDVITGNVTGGRGFRGNVGYTAPGEFRGTLGSNELFDFRASSLGSSPLITSAARQQAYQASAGGNESVVVYRGFSDIPRYVSQTARGTGTRFAIDGGSQGVFDPGQVAASASISDVLGGGARTIDAALADTLGEGPDTGQRAPSVTISPLLGIRIDRPKIKIEETTQMEDVTPAGVGSKKPSAIKDLSEMSRVEPRRFGATEQSMAGLEPDQQDTTGMVPSGILLGYQIMQGDRMARADDTVSRVEQRIFKQGMTTKADPGGDAYQNLLAQIRGAQASDDDTFGQRPDQPDDARMADGQTRERQPMDALPKLPEPEPEQVDETERAAADAMRIVRERLRQRLGRDQEQQADGEEVPTTADGEPLRPLDPLAEQDVPDSVRELVEKLRYDVPRVQSLVSEQSRNRAEKLMSEAQVRMADGEYFAAEGLYRNARALNPDNPLTMVGLIHAQLAAGMVRSASYNLRTLFEAHPELINVRYERQVLPPTDRLKWLNDELNRMINSQQYQTEPGLMLAYLGHQTESRQLVRYGLAVSQAQNPSDPLLQLLRAVWLEGQPAPEAGNTSQPEPEAQAPEADE